MRSLVKKIPDLPLLLLICLSSGVFLYRLGWGSLASFDEAWYAGIAQNIVQSGNFINLSFNNHPFIDHPPFGFWLMASSFKLLGVSEFAARLPSALLGVICIVAIYGLGKSLVNKHVGFMAGLILLSSLWFAFRARTGNLDVPLVSLSVLSFWFVYQSKKDPRWLVSAAAAFALALMTKTLVGLSLLAPLGLFVVLNHMAPKKTKASFGWVMASALVFLVFLLPWYLYQIKFTNDFFHHHFLVIGLRRRTSADILQTSTNFWLYLQSAMGKWFRLFMLSLPFGLLAILKNKLEYLWIWMWLAVVGLPFYFSNQTEIWHLIPLLPPMAILLAWHMRIPLPQLTEDRRKDLVKMVGKLAEEARVSVRNIRRHIVDDIKKDQKEGTIPEDDAHRLTAEIQKVTDDCIHSIDQTLKAKEEEIMEV